MAEHYCLKWNNYRPNLTSAFKSLREEEHFVDVTLSVEGINLKAHKVVLSACSNYFRDLLQGISVWQHPVLFLRDVPLLDLSLVLEFVYVGEVSVSQTNLQSFLKTAGLLRIKGLADDEDETEYVKKKSPAGRSDLSKRPEENKAADEGKPAVDLATRKRRLERDLGHVTKTLALKKSTTVSKASKFDTSNVKVEEEEELTLKQEPTETDLTTDPLNISEGDPTRVFSHAKDLASSYVKPADPPTSYAHSSEPVASSSASSSAGFAHDERSTAFNRKEAATAANSFGQLDHVNSRAAAADSSEKAEQNGVGKADLEGRVICHVCRAVLSNTNALCYHMNYVHSTSIQNIDMIRSMNTTDAVTVKEEIK